MSVAGAVSDRAQSVLSPAFKKNSPHSATRRSCAIVKAFEEPAKRRRRVLEAMLHVDLVLDLSPPAPSERTDRLARARHTIELMRKPSMRHNSKRDRAIKSSE